MISARLCSRRSSTRLSARATSGLVARSPPPSSRGSSGIDLPSDQAHQVAHDRFKLEILRRVDARNALRLERARILLRDDAAHDHGHMADARYARALEHLRHELEVRAAEHRDADHVHAF